MNNSDFAATKMENFLNMEYRSKYFPCRNMYSIDWLAQKFSEYGIWNTECGIWNMEYKIFCLAGFWNMTFGIWNMVTCGM